MNSSKEFRSVEDTQNQTPESSNIYIHSKKPAVYFSMLNRPIQDKNILNSTSLDKIDTKNIGKPGVEALQQQNKMLRQQNKELKKLVSQFQAQNQIMTADSSRHEPHHTRVFSFNPKEFEKKQSDQLHELTGWNEALKKQCRMYEEIINKMEQKISDLEQKNSKLNEQLRKNEQQKQNREKYFKKQKIELIQKNIHKESESKQMTKQLKDRVNRVMEKYSQLQSFSNNCQIQWAMWKDKWNGEKLCYMNRIIQLEKIVREYKETIKEKRDSVRNPFYESKHISKQKGKFYDSHRNCTSWDTQPIRARSPTECSSRSKNQKRKY